MEGRRVRRLVIALFVIFLMVAIRIFTNAFDSKRLLQHEEVPAFDGTVYDYKGHVLAAELLEYVAYFDKGYFTNTIKDERKRKRIEKELVDLGVSPEVYRKTPFPVVKRSSSLSDLVSSIPPDVYKFISISKSSRRTLINDESLKLILNPMNGVMAFYKSELSKKEKGYKTLNALTKEVLEFVPPVNGNDLYLTLDAQLQKDVSTILYEGIKKYNAKGGIIIVMETRTGAIKAAVNAYDWNFAAQGYFEPGSSIKPIIYAIALEEGLVSTSTVFDCEGSIQPLEDSTITIHDIEKHGKVNLFEALARSCNVASIRISKKIVEQLGEERFYWWLRRFGFGERSGVEILKETRGNLPPSERWKRITFAFMAIGQGIGVSAFQLIRAFNAVVNDGLLVTPHFLDHILDSSGKVKKPSFPVKRVVSSRTSALLRRMLKMVVDEGTGRKARVKGVAVAGKTGTAQKASEKGGYEPGKHYSVFLGFFPYENPAYTVLVMLDEPSPEFLGGDVAAPIFKKVVEVIVESSKDSKGKMRLIEGVVPDLRGLTVKDVVAICDILGLEVNTIGRGKAVYQEPEPGEIFRLPIRINVFFSYEGDGREDIDAGG